MAFAHPICPVLAAIAGDERASGWARPSTAGGTYVCMEGPQFSTLAESNLYRSWGMDIIGMTNLQEAKLAREAEICYVTIALVTDYDCWHPDHDSVTVEMIISNLTQNAQTAQRIIVDAGREPAERTCSCARRSRTAIITRPDAIRRRSSGNSRRSSASTCEAGLRLRSDSACTASAACPNRR